MERHYNVLFLCTGNSARSILAEAYLGHEGADRFRAYSAGSFPAGRVNPFALELLERKGIPTADFRSKSWNEFAAPGAPVMDLIITVCDSAAGEVCPVWPGEPITAHWGVPDPAAVDGDDAVMRSAFLQAYTVLARRIDILRGLRLDTLDRLAAERRIRQIPSEA